MEQQIVTITQAEYTKLLDDSDFLNALRNAGVDNWDGYDYAQQACYGDDEE